MLFYSKHAADLIINKNFNTGSGEILFLVSTNLPWSLDPAILRRFHKKILVNLPGEEERLNIILQCLHTEVTEPPPMQDLYKLAKVE